MSEDRQKSVYEELVAQFAMTEEEEAKLNPWKWRRLFDAHSSEYDSMSKEARLQALRNLKNEGESVSSAAYKFLTCSIAQRKNILPYDVISTLGKIIEELLGNTVVENNL